MSQKTTPFVLFPCGACGVVTKIDISKYRPTIQRGLKKDYGYRPPPIVDSGWFPHQCPTCNGNCKAPNGYGTQAAKDLERLEGIYQYIIKVLAGFDRPATVDEIRLHIDVMFGHKTTAITLHSRISDLVTWRIVQGVDLDGPTKPTGNKYEASAAVNEF